MIQAIQTMIQRINKVMTWVTHQMERIMAVILQYEVESGVSSSDVYN